MQTRREFLKRATLTAAAIAGFPTIIPARALGADGTVAPSNRVVIGIIGTGGRGRQNMQWFVRRPEVQVVSVCDVDLAHARVAKEHVDWVYGNTDCRIAPDFREITRRTSIDAVMIATPDHWHALMTIDAAKHGKDIYAEKPLTLTIGEGRPVIDAVRRYARVVQVGTQQRSMRNCRFACELARNGRLGTLRSAHVQIPLNEDTCGPTWTPEPVPDGFDYDFWLGPAPWAEYTKQRCHFSYRFIQDYSGGQVINYGVHDMDIAQWGLGMDNSGPVEITGVGEFPRSGLFNTALVADFTCTYANGVTLRCQTTGGWGTKFVGDAGWVYVNHGGEINAEPASLLKEIIGPDEIRLYESNDHGQNFLDCVRTRNPPVSEVEPAHRSATLCHLGNIAMLLGRKLKWDPVAEQFINDPAATQLLHRARRAPWDNFC